MAIIYPRSGAERDVAIALLAMSDNPRDVQTNSDSGLAFVVPEYLYERYLNGGVGPQETDPDENTPVAPELARRRPGRPRRAQPVKEGD